MARNSPVALTVISRSPRFTRLVGIVPDSTVGVARRTAATTPTTAHRTTNAAAHAIVRRLLMSTALLLHRWVTQCHLISRLQTLGNQDLVPASSSHFNFPFFKMRSRPNVREILSGLLKKGVCRNADGVGYVIQHYRDLTRGAGFKSWVGLIQDNAEREIAGNRPATGKIKAGYLADPVNVTGELPVGDCI